MAAISYLKELHQIFGDWTTVLAAYNCGEGTVLRVIRRQRINYLDHFWDLYEELPLETAFYVPKFLAVLHILNDPESHGFELPPVDEALDTEMVSVEKQVSLRDVSKELYVSYELLRDLNPALRRHATPERPYELRVPAGKAAILTAKLDEIPVWKPPRPSFLVHRVRRGESLSTIAERYHSSVRSIMAMNGLKSRHYIRVGWKLKIPVRKTYLSSRRWSSITVGSSGKYVVRKGDTLWKIAYELGLPTRTLMSHNGLRTSRLRIGQVLKIPSRSNATDGDLKKTRYIVSKGDSPYLIAQKYHMELIELLRLNNLTTRSTIFPGQTLWVKTD
jgi:membrane-bound lytic murein transglycosylase D